MLGFVDSFDNDPDASLVVGVFSVVAVEVGNTLLLMALGQPASDELLNLSDIHELNIVHMSVLLPLHHHVGRHTLIAHALGVRLMIFAASVDLIALL